MVGVQPQPPPPNSSEGSKCDGRDCARREAFAREHAPIELVIWRSRWRQNARAVARCEIRRKLRSVHMKTPPGAAN